MELITRQVIEKREGPNCPQEILDEYADPHTEKYEQMVQDICKMQNFTTLRYHRLDDLLESIGIDPCNVCTYVLTVKNKKYFENRELLFQMSLIKLPVAFWESALIINADISFVIYPRFLCQFFMSWKIIS